MHTKIQRQIWRKVRRKKKEEKNYGTRIFEF